MARLSNRLPWAYTPFIWRAGLRGEKRTIVGAGTIGLLEALLQCAGTGRAKRNGVIDTQSAETGTGESAGATHTRNSREMTADIHRVNRHSV